ncbi:MAG: hypothetical protein ABI878_09255 [Acidobacteriota bacterium]
MSQKFWIGDPETVSAVKRKNRTARIRVVSIVLGVSFLLVLVGNSRAQEPLSDPDAAPPPIKVLSKEEKQALDAETEVRKHTSVALELMNKRLSNAEAFNSAERFEDMYKELGSFHALMDNALEFLTKKDTDSSKVLNNFKKLEIGLRTFQPRLETIRRDLSLRYEPYIRTLIRYIHEAREKAIAPMFGDTVVRDKPES